MKSKFHPATFLVGWISLVLLVQSFSLTGVSLLAILVLIVAWAVAPARTLLLIRRTRWLLFSIFLLFAFGTPGERLEGAFGELGITHEGLLLATEHAVRLVLTLASLAAVHQRLGTDGLMAGLYWMLAPLAPLRSLRDRIVVRLMLVIEYVELPGERSWRTWLSGDERSGPDVLPLSILPATILDWTLILGAMALAMIPWWDQ